MGRPPSNGGPSFRFNPTEVAEMEAMLQAHDTQVPSREILVALAEKFSSSAERSGKVVVQIKQVWNWFQNRRYALRAKASKAPGKLSVSSVSRDDMATVRNVPQAPQHLSVPPAIARNVPQVPQPIPHAPAVQNAGRNGSDITQMEFEAKSARDGAWYDVASFISHRSVETSDPEVLVRFAGFGSEEDEWVNVRKHIRQRSLPCESSECVAVLPGDLILCFQEGKEQALYFDAHVLDAQRRRHDVRGCRCRFLVRYDHDQSEEIVPLRKVCRRPETDYRLQQLHAESANMNRNKPGSEPHTGNAVKVYPPAQTTQKLHKAEPPAETKEQLPKAELRVNTGPVGVPVSHGNASATTAALPNADTNITSAPVVAPAAQSVASATTTTAPIAHSNVALATVSTAATTTPVADSNVSKATATAPTPVTHSNVSGPTVSTSTPVGNSYISGNTTSAVTTPTAAENTTVSTTTPVANSDGPETTSSVVTTTTPVKNPNVSVATTPTPVTNSNDLGVTNSVTTSTAPVANSHFIGAPGVVPVAHSDVTPDAESKVLLENVSEIAAINSVETASIPPANIAVASSATTEPVTSTMVTGSSGENIQQG